MVNDVAADAVGVDVGGMFTKLAVRDMAGIVRPVLISAAVAPTRHLIAESVRALLAAAERQVAVSRAGSLVLAHPHAWNAEQTRLLVEAARDVGFSPERVRLVSAPVAAAHYVSRSGYLRPGATRLVIIDIGADSFDVAVLAVAGDTFSVVAAQSDSRLGGRQVDAAIRRWVDTRVAELSPATFHGLVESASESALLDERIRFAKEQLSDRAPVDIVVGSGDVAQTVTLTEEVLADLLQPEMARAIQATAKALGDAGTVGSTTPVVMYLTGGSARLRVLQRAAARFGEVVVLDDMLFATVSGALSVAAAVPSPPIAAPPPRTDAGPAAQPHPVPRLPVGEIVTEHGAVRSMSSSRRVLLGVLAVAVVAGVVAAIAIVSTRGSGGGGQTAAEPASPPAPSWVHGVRSTIALGDKTIEKLVVDDGTETAYVGSSRGISRIDLHSRTVTGQLDLHIDMKDGEPSAIGIDPDLATIYVLVENDVDAAMYFVDTANFSVGGSVSLPNKVGVNLAVDVVHHVVYVIGEHGSVTVDGRSRTVAGTIPISGFESAIDPPNHVAYAANTDLTATDTVTGAVRTMVRSPDPYVDPYSVVFDPATHKVYVASEAGVFVVDPETNAVTAVIAVDNPMSSTDAVALDPAVDALYVGTPSSVVVIDTRAAQVAENIPLKTGVLDMAVDPTTHVVYVIDTERQLQVLGP